MSLVSAFITNTSNSIMKSVMCFLSCLNILIFHLASAALFLSLNTVLISLINSSQSWKSFSSFIWLIFFCIYIPTTHSLSQTNISVILLSVAVTLLLLRNKHISLYQSSNFAWSSSNYHGSGTILLNIIAYFVLLYTADAVNISSISDIYGFVVLFSSKMYSLIILNDLSTSDSASMLSCLSMVSTTIILCLFSVLSITSCTTICVAISFNSLTVYL